MPGNRIALELIRAARTPIAAPSANASGKPSSTTASHVLEDLDGRIDLILDGGATKIGIESTVFDLTSDPPMILRPGWITREMLTESAGPIGSDTSSEQLRRSPGTMHRHYSPRARVILIAADATVDIERVCRDRLKTGSVGFIGHTRVNIESANFKPVILQESAAEYGLSIYSALRKLDEQHINTIVVEGISEAGEGAAVMDRLRRAASEIDSHPGNDSLGE
jgi:L-threonylcarbamoyladenylate synthase